MVIGEPIKWVIVEVSMGNNSPEVFIEPGTLSLPSGFVGTIVWYAFTEGYEVVDVWFPPECPNGDCFNGDPQPDPDRPGCISTAVANTGPAQFPYTISVRNKLTGEILKGDPVVENEPPPTHGMMADDRPQPFGLAATA
jgi:hypothetical protein